MTTLLVGRGLLGSAVARRLLADRVDLRTVEVPWADADAALEALHAVAAAVAAEAPDWRLVWCAGSGTVGAGAEHLAGEVELSRRFCADLTAAPALMFLASSAGGAYGGSPDEAPYDEHSRAVAGSAYGAAKLAMEEIALGLRNAGTRVLVGRFSNLYGPGQNLEKPQGLISQICRAQAHREALGVFVSFDTLRDYLYVDDAAAMVSAAMDRSAAEPAGTTRLKVFASGRSSTIGMVVHEANRAFRRPCRVVQRQAHDHGQGRDLRLRSAVWTDLDTLARTPLALGIRLTWEDVSTRRNHRDLAREAALR